MSSMLLKKIFRRKSLDLILSEAESGYGDGHGKLSKTLGLRDLTAFGIAAIIGAGIFSTIGNAAFNGGPAVSLLFVFTAIACAFSALCYAEFASSIPVSGSAYTYAYATFGEVVAWIIGWDLLLEYAIGNIAVAISWSDYFTGLMSGLGFAIPEFLTMDYLTAYRGNIEFTRLIADGKSLSNISPNIIMNANAWNNAPVFGSFRLIADLPALFIVILITYLVYRGIKESRTASNVMVGVKLLIIFLVIVLGGYYVNPNNWSPFAPNGLAGILKGVSAVFFAYIGFDAISTTAEECKSPQKDIPRSIIYSLIICTILYVVISLVLTGMVSYNELGVGDPLAYVFKKLNLNWISGIIAFSAVIAMASVLLVFQMGQPRIWMSMSRDGLFPRVFSSIHKKYKTPSFATIITGVLVGVPTLFMNLTEVTDLTSIGTLFAFVLVSGGILILPKNDNLNQNRFKVPYVNGKYILPILLILILIILMRYKQAEMMSFFNMSDFKEWDLLKNKIPSMLFVLAAITMSVLTFIKKLSLIPVLGMLSCLYLMTELGYVNWMRFIIWMLIGLVIYFIYGYRNSNLNSKKVSYKN